MPLHIEILTTNSTLAALPRRFCPCRCSPFSTPSTHAEWQAERQLHRRRNGTSNSRASTFGISPRRRTRRAEERRLYCREWRTRRAARPERIRQNNVAACHRGLELRMTVRSCSAIATSPGRARISVERGCLPHDALFQHLNVFENVAFGLRVRKRRSVRRTPNSRPRRATPSSKPSARRFCKTPSQPASRAANASASPSPAPLPSNLRSSSSMNPSALSMPR